MHQYILTITYSITHSDGSVSPGSIVIRRVAKNSSMAIASVAAVFSSLSNVVYTIDGYERNYIEIMAINSTLYN